MNDAAESGGGTQAARGLSPGVHRRGPRALRALGDHRAAVPRAPHAVLEQSLRGVGGQGRGAGPRRRDGARGHPPAGHGTLPGPVVGRRETSGHAAVSRQSGVDRAELEGGALRRQRRQDARSASTRIWRAKFSSCTRSEWTAATPRPMCRRLRRRSPDGRSAARTMAAGLRNWGSTTARPVNSSFATSSTSPAPRKLLGKSYGDDGVRQGEAMLRDLAMRRETARHVSTKLARHFIADDPPKAVVDRMTHAWLDSKAHLPTVYKALVESPEAWEQPLAKFKTPADYIYSRIARSASRCGEAPRAAALRGAGPAQSHARVRPLAGRMRARTGMVRRRCSSVLPGPTRSRSAWATRATHATWRPSC